MVWMRNAQAGTSLSKSLTFNNINQSTLNLMKISSIILTLFLSYAYCFGQETAKQEVNIGVLLDRQTEEIAPLFKQLSDEIKAVVGEDANVVFSDDQVLFNDLDIEKAEQNYQNLINSKVDIILAFGVINNVVVSRQEEHRKPTILFGAAPGDFAELDKTKSSSGIHNLVYLVTSQSFVEDLDVFSELYEYKRIGVAAEQELVNNLPVTQVLDNYFRDKDATYKLIPFLSAQNIIDNLGDVDALYLGGGFLLTDDEITTLSDALIEKGIPSFTASDVEDVKRGLMASNQTEETLEQIFRRIALSVEAIVNGQDAGDLPLYFESNQQLTINYNTADRLRVPLRYSLIATTTFVGDFNDATAEKQYNLLEVMHEAQSNNLTLLSSAKDVELSGQDVKTAKSNYLPELTASATSTYLDPDLASISNGQNPEYSTTGNVTVSQTIYAPAASANVRIQQDLNQAQQQTYNADRLDAIFNASGVYFNALLLKANLQITSSNLETTKRNLQIAQQNFESGQTSKADVLRFRSQLAQNMQALVEAINQLEQAFFSLNQVLNYPINRRIDVQDAALGEGVFEEYDYAELRDFLDNSALREPFVEFLVQKALENAPELKSLNYNLSATERNLKLAENGRFLPTLAVQGQYNWNISRGGVGTDVPVGFPSVPNTNYNVGLNLSIPIFQRNQQNINRQTALIQKDQLGLNRDNLELNIERNVNVAVLQLINQIANIELSKVSEATAKESLELTQEAYSSGAVTWVELIDAQDNYRNAQLANASAVYNYLLSAIELERYLGFFFLLQTAEANREFRQNFFAFLSTKN